MNGGIPCILLGTNSRLEKPQAETEEHIDNPKPGPARPATARIYIYILYVCHSHTPEKKKKKKIIPLPAHPQLRIPTFALPNLSPNRFFVSQPHKGGRGGEKAIYTSQHIIIIIVISTTNAPRQANCFRRGAKGEGGTARACLTESTPCARSFLFIFFFFSFFPSPGILRNYVAIVSSGELVSLSLPRSLSFLFFCFLGG
jgi:hypothetical protein